MALQMFGQQALVFKSTVRSVSGTIALVDGPGPTGGGGRGAGRRRQAFVMVGFSDDDAKRSQRGTGEYPVEYSRRSPLQCRRLSWV